MSHHISSILASHWASVEKTKGNCLYSPPMSNDSASVKHSASLQDENHDASIFNFSAIHHNPNIPPDPFFRCDWFSRPLHQHFEKKKLWPWNHACLLSGQHLNPRSFVSDRMTETYSTCPNDTCHISSLLRPIHNPSHNNSPYLIRNSRFSSESFTSKI